MAQAVKDADFVIGGVSSFGVDWFGEEVLTKLPASLPVLSVTKGLLDTPDGRLLTYPAVWESRLAAKGIARDICAIGGPCTSYELVAHDQTEVAFCGKDLLWASCSDAVWISTRRRQISKASRSKRLKV
jgi:glycerol-3-phosphate dehydrogenase (NAD(P)+)